MERCAATLPDGTPCHTVTHGSTWCGTHMPELRRKYLKYKALECTIDLTRDVSTLSDERLQTLCELLFHAILLRQTVCDRGYGGYADAGHEKRIELMNAYLCQVQEQLQQRYVARMATITAPPEPESPARPAQATSTRQQRRRKVAQIPGHCDEDMLQRERALCIMLKQISNSLLAYVMDTGRHMFTEKFGDKGPALFDIAMCMANQVSSVTCYRYSTAAPGTVLNIKDLTGPARHPPTGFTQHNYPLSMTNNNGTVLYCFFIVMYSFRMTIVPTFNDYEAPIDAVTPGLSTVEQCVTASACVDELLSIQASTGERRNLQLAQRLKVWCDVMDYPLPQLDVAFCMRIHSSAEKYWSLIHLGDGNYRFLSTTVVGAVLDFSRVKNVTQCAAFVCIRKDALEQWCDRILPQGNMIQSVLVALPNNYGIIPLLGVPPE